MTRTAPAQFARFFAAGVFAGSLAHGLAPAPVSGGAAFFALPVAAALLRRRCSAALLLGFSFAFVRFDGQLRVIAAEDSALRGSRVLEGTVRDAEERSGSVLLLLDRLVLVGGVERRAEQGTALVAAERYPAYATGERLRVRCALRAPAPPFVREERVLRDAVRAVCREPSAVERIAPPGAFRRALDGLRAALAGGIGRALPSPQAELAEGLLLGAHGAPLPRGTADAFRAAGVTHIVAASGYNVSLVAHSVAVLLLAVGMRRSVRLGASLAFVWGYVLLAGATAAVVRAGAMASMVVAAKLLGRPERSGHSLLLAAAGMLLLNPALLLFDVGFELTLAATAGLVIIGPRLVARHPRLFGRGPVTRTLTETVSAILATLPVIAWRFGTVSVIAPVANLLVVPAVPAAMVLAAAVAPSGLLFPGVAHVIGLLAWLPLSYIVNVARLLAALPFASVALGAFPWWGMAALYGLVWLLLREPGNGKGERGTYTFEGYEVATVKE